MFKFFAMTTFAIFRVSKGLKGLGDFENLLLLERGVPVRDENCKNHQPKSYHRAD